MTPLEVRAATPEDLAAIWELMHGLAKYERMTEIITGTRAQLGEALFGERAFVEAMVAESGGRLLGYALFYPTFSSFRTRSGIPAFSSHLTCCRRFRLTMLFPIFTFFCVLCIMQFRCQRGKRFF